MIIPSYNRGNLLLSDLKNGYKFSNLQKKIIVDDNSNLYNKELQEIEEMKNIGLKNILYGENNIGISGNFKRGFNNITEKNVLTIGDDDMLFCLNKNNLIKEYNEYNENNDICIVIPRYVLALTDNKLSIQYDRNIFNNKNGLFMLEYISKYMHIHALMAGSIISNNELLKYFPNDNFITGEDALFFIKFFYNNLNKKILVSENYIYVRRMHNNSISSTVTNYKLSLNIINQLIGSYYCYLLKIFNKKDIYNNIINRSLIFEKKYNFDKMFIKYILDYFEKNIDENTFIEYYNKNIDSKYIKKTLNEFSNEINLLLNII
jgi:hypothetical protein